MMQTMCSKHLAFSSAYQNKPFYKLRSRDLDRTHRNIAACHLSFFFFFFFFFLLTTLCVSIYKDKKNSSIETRGCNWQIIMQCSASSRPLTSTGGGCVWRVEGVREVGSRGVIRHKMRMTTKWHHTFLWLISSLCLYKFIKHLTVTNILQPSQLTYCKCISTKVQCPWFS